MKIIKIIHGYPPIYNAGSEVYSQSICDELSKKNEITIFTREENPYEQDFKIRTEKQHGNLTIYFVNKRIDKDNYKNENIDKQSRCAAFRPAALNNFYICNTASGIYRRTLTSGTIQV